MYPSRSSSTDPNAAYRDAIAALADNCICRQEGQPDDVCHNQSAQNQPNILAGLNPRRTTNRDRLNAIAHNISTNVGIARQLIRNSEIPTTTLEAAPSSGSSINISTVCQYLREKGCGDNAIADEAIQKRLNSAKLSAETLLAAIETAHDANHPIWLTLRANDSERIELIRRLAGIVSLIQGIRPKMKLAIRNSNNNSEQMIANILDYMRSLNTK